MMNCRTVFQCATLCNSHVKPKTRALEYLENKYQSLSPEEQQRVDRDLYGIVEPVEESPAFVAGKIKDLREELDRIDNKKKSAYSQAMVKSAENNETGSSYVTSDEFFLLFLRAEDFNAKASARRMVRYFKEKLELFGYDKLDHKIKQEDLNEEDIASLYGGAASFTGATDKAGRLIIFVRPYQMMCEPLVSLKRSTFYLFEAALGDNEVTQRSGLVTVTNNIRPPGPQKLRHTSQVKKIFPYLKMVFFALPSKTTAVHECYNDLSYHFYLSLALMVLPKSLLPRMVLHYGTNIDCMCELLAYGIDADTLPITFQGDFRNVLVHNYLQGRRALETKDENIENRVD